MALDEIKRSREEKLDKLKDRGIDPYPSRSWRSHRIREALADFEKFAGDRQRLVLVGRIIARREHGGAAFFDIFDGSGTIQAYLKKDVIGEKDFQFILDTIDIGDFVELYGFLFKTKKAERTIEVEKYRLLVKSLLPLPEKWHGLTDVEERFRKRYLDFIFNDEVRKKFKTRTKIIQEVRNFLNSRDFMEVTTPTLQPLYGGASARPFKTHLNILDIDLFLRIAPELYLKRLLVGGFEAVFEFTTNFRNEGIDRDHNPEFSAVEFYAAYKDHEWAMQFTEDMFTNVLNNVIGRTKIEYQGKEIHFTRPYFRSTFSELFKQHLGLDLEYADSDSLKKKAEELGVKIEKTVDKTGLADEIFKKAIRPQLIEPTFVFEYPVELLPLAKRLENPGYVGAFQFYAGGLELIKAFTELNDPIDQRKRFEAQERLRAKGDQEAQRLDEDFIQALEYGMPPAAGWGLGLDRFVALLTNSHSLREVILFPLMKPRR